MGVQPPGASDHPSGPADAERVPCPLCGETAADAFAEDRGHRFVRCADCSFVFIADRHIRRAMRDVYTADSQTAPEQVAAYAFARTRPYRHALGVVRRVCPGGGTLLDVGCRYGLFLGLACDAGYEPAGIEIARDEAEYARRETGCQVYEQPLEELGLPPASQDVVVLLDVIEHLDEPMTQLREACRVLKPGKAAVVRVPNLCLHALKMRALTRVLGRRRAAEWARKSGLMGLQAPSHLNWFTAGTLRRALQTAGFSDVRIGLGPPELTLPTRLRTRITNCLKSTVCTASQGLFALTGRPVTTLVATARKPEEAPDR